MIKPFQAPANLFKTLSHPARLAILTILRDGEQCVCHIEAMLKLRDGWNMYYHIAKTEIVDVLDAIYTLTGQPDPITHLHAAEDCPCPKCHPPETTISVDSVTVSSEV